MPTPPASNNHQQAFPHPILKQGPKISILAATGIKLSCRPTKLTPQPSARAEDKASEPAATATAAITAKDGTATVTAAAAPPSPPPIKKIPRTLATSKARERQATFLERLMTIKAAKGETDEVTVQAQHSAPKPSARRSRHKRTLTDQAIEADENGNDNDSDQPPTTSQIRLKGSRGKIGRPRTSGWRRGRPFQSRGGLFRDYRVPHDNNDGGSIENSPLTPESWAQLSQPHQPAVIVSEPITEPPGNSLNTHPHPPHPQASSPKTAPSEIPSPPLPHDPYPGSLRAQTTGHTTGHHYPSDAGSGGAAIARGTGEPSPVDVVEGRRSALAVAALGAGGGADVGSVAVAAAGVGGGGDGVDADADVVMADG